jgi:hypothetical protein
MKMLRGTEQKAHILSAEVQSTLEIVFEFSRMPIYSATSRCTLLCCNKLYKYLTDFKV